MDEKSLIRGFYESFFTKIDLKQQLRHLVLDGYDTYEDYVKYGDALVPVSPQRSEQSSRVLALRRPA